MTASTITSAETCSSLHGIVAVRLRKYGGSLGIEFESGTGCKEDRVIVKRVVEASVAHRCGAVEMGDMLLAIDDIPTDNMTIDEAQRLIATSHDFIKLHINKRGRITSSIEPTKRDRPPSFRFCVKLAAAGQPLGLTLDNSLCVTAVEKNGLVWR